MTLLEVAAIALAVVAIGLVWALKIEMWQKLALRKRLRAVQAVAGRTHQANAQVYEHHVARTLKAAGRTQRLPLKFTSQYGEDRFLYDLFDGATEGTYIEVGAYDGVSLSVSYPFEAIGWTGFLIEALADRYEECCRNRPGSQVVHGALTKPGHESSARFTRVEGEPGSDMRSYLETHAEHHAQIEASGSKEADEQIEVRLTTMNEVLSAHDGPIDFASIDVEGNEADVIRGFDLARYKPRVLLVEDTRKRAADEIGPVVLPQGYTEAGKIGCNRVFIRTEEAELRARYEAATASCTL